MLVPVQDLLCPGILRKTQAGHGQGDETEHECPHGILPVVLAIADGRPVILVQAFGHNYSGIRFSAISGVPALRLLLSFARR